MHVMIDIETLGTRPGSVVASIGAVVFNPIAGVSVGEFFDAGVAHNALDDARAQARAVIEAYRVLGLGSAH